MEGRLGKVLRSRATKALTVAALVLAGGYVLVFQARVPAEFVVVYGVAASIAVSIHAAQSRK
jgi:hypothetical protein